MDKSKALRTEVDILTMDVDPISQLAKVNNWKNQIFAKLIRMGNMKYKLTLEANILISSNLQLKHSRQTKIRAEETKIGGMIMSTIDSNSLWRLTHHEDYEATKTHSGHNEAVSINPKNTQPQFGIFRRHPLSAHA